MTVHQMHARDLLGMSIQQVWQLPMGAYDVTFDNGEVVRTTSRRNMFSRYCWIIHENYPETPLLPHHHIGMATINRMLHGKVLGPAIMDCKEAMNGDMHFMETLWELTYIATENIFNDWSENMEEYVTSTSPLDYIELRQYPPIKALNDAIKSKPNADEKMIAEHANALTEIILKDKGIEHNQVIRGVRIGSTRLAPVLQIIGLLGFKTDVDSVLFRPAILSSYSDGINDVRETATESRDATINIFYQKKPMQDSEWGNRVIQIMAATMQNLKDVDCGSTNYVEMKVDTHEKLQDMAGKFHLTAENKLEAITATHRHLIGQTVKIRSVLTCRLHDRYSICSKCFGELSYSVPENTNIGHTCCTQVIGPIGQYMLSFKHYSGTAKAEKMQLIGNAADFLEMDDEGFYVRMKPEFKGVDIKLLFSDKEAPNLLDIHITDEIEKLKVDRITKLTGISLIVSVNNATTHYHLDVGSSAINPSFTIEFLKHIRKYGWDVLDRGWYSVSMRDWDFNDPIMVSPNVQFSPPQYMRQVIGFIKGTREQNKRTVDSVVMHDSMGTALEALNEMVGRKLRINIAHLEVVLQATKVASVADRDYRPPIMKEMGQPVKFDELMQSRSLAATFAWQYHEAIPFNPNSFLIKNRPPHPFDNLYPD